MSRKLPHKCNSRLLEGIVIGLALSVLFKAIIYLGEIS